MLYSQFFVDEDRYVISANEIVEIIPFVSLKLAPTLPNYVAGLMNYHGSAMPVIDICCLLIDRVCQKKLSTRIIVVEKVMSMDVSLKLGFMVERATEMVVVDENTFKSQAMKNLDSPTNGLVAVHQEYLIEKLSVNTVFDRLDKKLFSEESVFSSESVS